MNAGLRAVRGVRFSSVRPPSTEGGDERAGGRGEEVADEHVVVEEPLAIRVSGDTIAVTMRTPGHDRELVMGFLFGEGILSTAADVAAIAHCGRSGTEERENTVEVTPAPGAKLRLPEDTAVRRGTLVSSACGVCGRTSIADLMARCAPVEAGGVIRRGVIAGAIEALRGRQPLFARTGGCHAASLVTWEGEHVATFEDVGRHNAVDKLVGSLLLSGALPATRRALVVSGRTSFEIVQKAVVAGIPVVVGVSAASSLAVDVARRAGVTLAGFARAGGLLVYAGEERIAGE